MNELSDVFTGYCDGDVDTNRSGNTPLASIVEQRYSRRQTMFGGVAALTTAALSTSVLSACSSEGGNGTDTTPLQVSAGQNGQTSSGRPVTLNGTTSFGVASTRFEQVSGPSVTVSDPSAMSVSFIAPSVAQATPLVFRFTGTDFAGRTASSETTITVMPAQLGFQAVAKSRQDRVIVPEGYSVTVLYALGDPIKPGVPAYANDGTDAQFDQRAGDHHDALYYYGLSASGGPDMASNNRGLLVMNHENITQVFLHPANANLSAPRDEAQVLKEMNAHGVAIVEVTRGGGSGPWTYSQNSQFNRRITPLTPVELSGPVRGDAQVRTRFSPQGTSGRGTINNCANGYTAWNTYLTCEENWAFYFRRNQGDDNIRTATERANFLRYGIRQGNSGNYGWTTVQNPTQDPTIYSRWNATADPGQPADGTGDFRNEPNQFGWVVEIDPYDPTKAPRKRTALGRFAHEGAWPGKFVAGVRPAIYMGDDSRNEYLYKFVSAAPWAPADAQAADRLAIGDKYLDAGTLYVARFNADGTGTWIPLVFGQNGLTSDNARYGFRNQADVLINTRIAADIVGATPMDRPEWTAVNPQTGEMYLTLTNTNDRSRPITATSASNPRFYNDPKRRPGFQDNDPNATQAQRGNPNGHIIRLRESGDTTEATAFQWDIYVFGSGADLNPANINISGLTDANDFSSPDGLWFARESNASGKVNPLLWIQTDDGAYTDVTNNQMLAAMPGRVGDGQRVTINNVGTDGAIRPQETIVGRAPGTDLRRFLVGPIEAEITGIDSTPDGRTLFVNIQHPGEDVDFDDFVELRFTSNWPASQATGTATSRPRSATIVITKNDGGIVGL